MKAELPTATIAEHDGLCTLHLGDTAWVQGAMLAAGYARVYTFDDKGRRHYTDYWCDICSIPMYEIKPCDCCQEEIRLRSEPQELSKDIAPK